MTKSKKGFTLVELLVTIAILAVLAAVSVVGYLGFTAKANLSADREEASQMSRSLQYLMASEEGLAIEDFDDLNSAVKRATDNAFDLENYSLRSASKGYNLWFNTKNNSFEVVKDYSDLQKENIIKRAQSNSLESYSGVESFLWSNSTPYLFAGLAANNDLAKAVKGLMNASESDNDSFGSANAQSSFKAISSEFKNEILSNAYVNSNGNLIRLDKNLKSEEVKNKILFSRGITTINNIDKDLEIKNPVTLPKTVKKLSAGALSNVKVENVVVKNKDITVEFNGFKAGTTVTIPESSKPENIFSAVTEDINIKKGDKNGTLSGNELVIEGEDPKTVEANINEAAKNKIEAWTKSVDALKLEIQKTYDAYSFEDEIVSLNDSYNKLDEWEKSYLSLNYKKSLEAFYNETKSNDKLVLDATTGIYNRYEIYNGLTDLITNSIEYQSLNMDIEENNYDLVQKFSGLLLNSDRYAIAFGDQKTSANTICFDNLFIVEARTDALQYAKNGLIINLNRPANEAVIKVSAKKDLKEMTLKLSTTYGLAGVEFETQASALTIGSQNEFMVAITINGKFSKDFTKADLKLELSKGGNLPIIELIKLDANKYLVKASKPSARVDLDDLVLTVAYGLSTESAIQEVSIIDATNIYNTDLLNKSNGNGSTRTKYVLNVSFNYAPGNQNTYSVNKGIITYNTNASNIDKHISFTNANVYGNGNTLNASQDNKDGGTNSSMSLIYLNNSSIDNINLILADSQGYRPTGAFNIGAAGIYTDMGATISNTSVSGSSRGVRLATHGNNFTTKLNNVVINGSMVAVEIYADANVTASNVILDNVDINSSIKPTKDNDNLKNGMGVLFFPGGRGAGTNNFGKIKLEILNNFSYDGLFDKKETKNILTTIITGLSDKLESLGNALNLLLDLNKQLNEAFTDTNGKAVTKVSPAIIMPIRLNAKAIGKDIIKGELPNPDSYIINNSSNDNGVKNEFIKKICSKNVNALVASANIAFNIYINSIKTVY